LNPIRQNTIAIGAVFAAVFHFATQPTMAWADEIDVIHIMTKNYSISRVEDSAFEATFTLVSKQGNERTRKTAGSTKLQPNGLDQMRITRLLSPPDVSGMSTLVVERTGKDDDIWVYLPALKKVRRLVSNNKKDSFLGTDFSYADVIGYPVFNWSYHLVREEVLNGEACYVISGIPKTDLVKANSGYSKRVDWVRKSNFVTVRSEYFDEHEQPLTTATFGDVRMVDQSAGKWQAMRLEAHNTQTGHRTVIQFDSFKVNQKIDEQIFTVRHMERP
jgi:outer membrane lipoprotein-sorting protein